MATSVHDTVRLDADLTGILPTNQYRVRTDGLDDQYGPIIMTERSLTGRLLVHRLMDGTDPEVYQSWQYELILTRAEKDQILLDLGRVLYFMPHVRDEATTNERFTVVFKGATDVQNFDPMLDYWKMTIELEEATGNSV